MTKETSVFEMYIAKIDSQDVIMFVAGHKYKMSLTDWSKMIASHGAVGKLREE